MSHKRLIASYVLYLGTLTLLLFWVAVTIAWQNDWEVTLFFDMFNEGAVELVVLSIIITTLPAVWLYAFEQL